MSLELIREAVRANQVIGEESTQTIVESDIIVPDVKPDIASILLLDGDVFIINTEISQDRLLVSGSIRYKILYVSEDEERSIKSINFSTNFSYGLDIPDIRNGMKSKVKCEIEHIDYEILNGRKVNVKAIIGLGCKVTNEVQYEIANDLTGIDDIQVLRNKAEINYYLGENNAECTVKESMEVPAGKPTIREILRSDVKIAGKDFKVTDGRIIAKGELNISTLYIGDDEEREIQFMEHEIPFSQFVDLEGVNENSTCDVEYRISDMQFEPAEDGDGELRVLNGEVSLMISASAFEKRSFDVIEDAYSPRTTVNLEKEPVSMEEVAAENKSQIILKENMMLSGEEPEIVELFNVLSKPSLSECKVLDDKVLVEGVVNNNVLYLANNSDQPIFCHQHEVPFKQTIDIKGIKADMGFDVVLDIDHCNYSMTSANEVEIRLVIAVNIKVMSMISMPVIARASENAIDDKRILNKPSIIIYFTQPGDNLWKIAKRYYTTVENIQKANNLFERESIVSGQQIIIPRKL